MKEEPSYKTTLSRYEQTRKVAERICECLDGLPPAEATFALAEALAVVTVECNISDKGIEQDFIGLVKTLSKKIREEYDATEH